MAFRKFDENRPRTDFFEYYQDFLTTSGYTATDWTISSTGTTPTAAVNTGADGGQLVITISAADDDRMFFDNKIEAFKFVLGKALEFEARWKLNEVIQVDAIFGLQITDTTPLAVSDGIWFQIDDGDALLDFHAGKNSTQSDLTGIATLVADTYIKTGFYYDGSTPFIQVYLNDVRVGAVPLTNVVDDEELCVSFGCQNGEAVAKIMTIDYFRVRKER